MARINRRVQGATRNTISVTLPHDCIITLNRVMHRYGNNRSLTLEYIIKDWERARQADRQPKEEKSLIAKQNELLKEMME